MIGEPAIAGVQQARNDWNSSCRVERPGPPNLPREINHRLGAAVPCAFHSDDTHFAEQLRRRQIKESLYARVLQGCEAKAARFESTLEPSSERSADLAVAVEADPAAAGLSSFAISYF